ncbi:MAG TPA: hypothetical protein VG817_07315, partial [Gemmatimonadales bacterium]|nr:hypothetical protein [Gemmatimonadales bacterium]
MPPTLRLSILGSIKLRGLPQAEADRLTAQPKRCALLLYLALARPRGWHRRDTLLHLLWPELDESHARNALSQALHHLRRVLGADTIEGNGADLLRLNSDRLSVDAWEFEQLASRTAPDTLRLYTAEAARGFHLSGAPEFAQWLDGERHRLQALAAGAAVSVADA